MRGGILQRSPLRTVHVSVAAGINHDGLPAQHQIEVAEVGVTVAAADIAVDHMPVIRVAFPRGAAEVIPAGWTVHDLVDRVIVEISEMEMTQVANAD